MDINSLINAVKNTPAEVITKAVIGGSLISLASSLNLLLTGRITGMSGICFKALTSPMESYFRWCNILGLIGIASGYTFFYGTGSHDTPQTFIGDISLPLFLFAAFLVGFGTKLGNGCTSGHGVCGLPRFSIRSFVAVLCFLSTGLATATFKSQVPFGTKGDLVHLAEQYQNEKTIFISFCLSVTAIFALLFYQTLIKGDFEKSKDGVVSVLIGAIFGLGLIVSGMVRKSKIIGFLVLGPNWDPSLIFVLFSAVGINVITFNIITRSFSKSLLLNQLLEIPTSKTIDLKLVLGACIFGIGWGLSGLCPGPAIINCFLYLPHLVLFIIVLLLGQITADRFATFVDRNSILSKIKIN